MTHELIVTEAGDWTVVTGGPDFPIDEICLDLKAEGIDHFRVHDLRKQTTIKVAEIEDEFGYKLYKGKISVAFEKTGLKAE